MRNQSQSSIVFGDYEPEPQQPKHVKAVSNFDNHNYEAPAPRRSRQAPGGNSSLVIG